MKRGFSLQVSSSTNHKSIQEDQQQPLQTYYQNIITNVIMLRVSRDATFYLL